MKLAELERHLRHHGCVLYREGAAHSIWFNPPLHKIASVPRHSQTGRKVTIPHHTGDLAEGTLRAILREPGIDVQSFLKA